MEQLPSTIVINIAVLALFLTFIAVIKYAVSNDFVRARLLMTSFFCFIVLTLTMSFWHYAQATLPFTTPAAALGIVGGYILGVRTEQRKLRMQGLQHYMQHFAHIHLSDFQSLTWWSFINFYSIMGGLLLINLVGFSTVIFHNSEKLAIATSVVGAFLLGTIMPYLLHLWTIRAPRH